MIRLGRRAVLVGACVLGGVVLLWCLPGVFWVEYVPVLSVPCAEPYYDEFPELAGDSEFLDAAEAIFERYGQPYRRDENTMYIRRSLARDSDLLANYSRKALGEAGLEMPPRTPKYKERHLDFGKIERKDGR